MVSPLLVPYGLTTDHLAYARIGVLLVVTIAISSFSWHYIEQPFLGWKKALALDAHRKLAPVPVAYAMPASEV
jgi:peptidoglycan/LPS O-acetylase OafA/YrhL